MMGRNNFCFINNIADQFSKVKILFMKMDLPGFEPRHVQKAVDHDTHLLNLLIDLA